MPYRHPPWVRRDGSSSIEIFRLDAGSSWYVRTLGRCIGGLSIHWLKGKGQYCRQRHEGGCPHCRTNERFWRGYLQCEVYEERHQLWHAALLEVTEHAEHDMSDLLERGQVWLVEKRAAGKRRPKMSARFMETIDGHSLPTAFPAEPILIRVYNTKDLRWDEPNPVPRPLYYQPSRGAAPSAIDTADCTPASSAEIREALQRAMNTPSTRNGSHHG